MPLTRAETVELLLARSNSIGADLVEPLANFIHVARDLLHGDAEKVLLMMLIIVRSNLHPEFRKIDPAAIRSGELERLPTLGINLRSLADSTGIPKETVRRKVQDLVKAGWVERYQGNLHYTPAAYVAAQPAREALMRMAARTYEVVGQVVASAE